MLKRLEIQGFKSFADRVELVFNSGLTVIVGPNGSGKSNIADAIRWVLGEQSVKNLRGSRLEDVIFSGSMKRRPVGMAEVSLTLDNSDGRFPLEFSEITVTRRVYRNGESEFLINRTPCRLKDIHELFLDTGLGRDAYSIIGQGRVEEILNARPEERRSIIEEAAGIVRFRLRKQEAERKLQETEADLVRVEDIINELEGQLEPLERQAAVAEQYLTYQREHQELEIGYLVRQGQQVKERLTELQEQYQELVSAREEAAVTLSRVEAERNRFQQELEPLEAELQRAQEQYTNLLATGEQTNGQLQVLSTQKQGLEEQRRLLERQKQEVEAELADGSQAAAADAGLMEELENNRQRLQAELKQQEERLLARQIDSAALDRQLQAAMQEMEQAIAELGRIQRQQTITATQQEGAGEKQTRLREEIQQLQTLLAQWQGKAVQSAEKAQELAESQADLEQQRQELARERVAAEAEIARLQKESAQRQQQIQLLTSKIKVLSEMQQEYEGYQKAVRELLMRRQKGEVACREICGVVAELLSVPKQYELAIEVALGGSLQHLVTETDQGAKIAIEYLKKQNLGRATFLPLNTVSIPTWRADEKQAVLGHPGVIGLAADLVSFDEKYRPVVLHLLGRIVVCQDLETGMKLARSTGYRYRIVTLAGDVLNPGGSLTGGSWQRRSASLIGRNRELEELQQALREEERQQKELRAKLAEAQARLQEYQARKSRLEEEFSRLQLAQLEVRRDEQEARNRQEELAARQTQLLQELEEYSRENRARAEELAALAAKESQLQDSKNEAEKRLELARMQLQELERELAEIQSGRMELKVKLAQVEQQLAGLKTIDVRQRLERKRRQQQLEQIQIQLQELDTEEREIANQYSELLAGREKLQRETEDCLACLQQLRQKRQTLQAEEKELLAKWQQSQTQMQELERALHQLDLKRTRQEAEWESITQRLWDDFGLVFNQEQVIAYQELDTRQALRRIKELKGLMAELGQVNLGAIEEYRRIQERYTFLNSQARDLKAAKASLYDVIAEMEEIMARRFNETFVQVAEHFSRIFTELFGGGQACLQLTEPDNLLTTGVEIIAQPPGKKTQQLSLLSGGEKALTAISLLFAILEVRPSPFVVLDEIEAALDEANVTRFADYVRKFSDRVQFLAVSHRKGTMEAADILYGVTMDDSGSSKILALQMTN